MDKKVKLLSVIFMSLGVFAGCNKEEVSSSQTSTSNQITSSSESTSSSSVVSKSKEELFAEFKKAFTNKIDVNEVALDLDIGMFFTMIDGTDIDFQDIKISNQITFDKSKDLLFTKMNQKRTEMDGYYSRSSEYSGLLKQFKEDDKRYFANKDSDILKEDGITNEETYYDVNLINYNMLDEFENFYETIVDTVPNYKLANDYDSLSNNYIEIMENIFDFIEEDLHIESYIDINQIDNEIVLKYSFEATANVDVYDNLTYDICFNGVNEVGVKDERISFINSSMIGQEKGYFEYNDKKINVYHVEESKNYSMKIDYKFDEELYNSFEVKMPENKDEIDEVSQSNYHYITLITDGIEKEISINLDVEENELKDEFLNSVSQYDGVLHYVTLGSTFYLDEEKTQILDVDNITHDSIKNITHLYGTMDVEEGYTVVQETVENELNVSDKYLMFIPGVALDSFDLEKTVATPVTYAVGSNYAANYYYADSIFVNGEEINIMDRNSIKLSDSKVNIIKHKSIIQDDDIEINSLFGGAFGG